MRLAFLRMGLAAGMFFFVVSLSNGQVTADPVAQSVMQVDEAFRIAKLNKDIAALSRILHENCYEMNQNGNGRDKAGLIELFKTFPIRTLTTNAFQVRITGDTASVTGTQTENGGDRMLFLRVYVKGANGWQLLSSMQARNPKAT